MGRSIARLVAILTLAITGVLGIHNGVLEWTNPYTPFQRLVYVGVVLYGALGLIAVYAVVRRRSWSDRVVVAWGAAITFVSGTAAIAYGGPDVTAVAAIAGLLGGALVAAFVVWATRAPSRVVSYVTEDAP
jgi:membrane associated rhomboid family serine protease